MKYETIGSPISYGGLQLKNRIIFAPTSMGLTQDEYFEKIRRIAAGGCAMIIIGDVPVLKGGFGPSLYTRKGFAFYRRLAEIVHKEDCRICAQLHQSDSNLAAMIRYLPGVLTHKISMQDLRVLLNQQVGPYITGMPVRKIRKITEGFGKAAQLARQAGFDMVQVHGDRMCGSFSSSVFNHRTDEYGGSAEHRARFAVECVQAVHRSVPDLPIDYKLAVRQENPHYGNAGVLVEELSVFVPLLEQAGVTSFHVTLANHSNLEDTIPGAKHPQFSAEGCFLPFCDAVRQYTSLPICGVGGLTSPDFVEKQLADGRIDCAAMCRQLIADPDWVNKTLHGQTGDIHRCLRCNRKCLGGIQQHQGVHCIYEGGNRT
ncbi:MAG: NADH:flavin oxidoreductase [Gemmiger sp.]|uniref:bilirubin reductase n=1 Tax=Gemmiger sp. TaxID=2049027 RepID=UPI002E75D6C2|nr:bilirubin reductase [Gemmiger sp.]MEE0800019.1 NADH:flavin oxidoreductase [Gemmiger sp.]